MRPGSEAFGSHGAPRAWGWQGWRTTQELGDQPVPAAPQGHLGHSLPPGRICRSLEGERIFPALQDPGSTSLLETVHVAFLLAIPQVRDGVPTLV